MYILNSPRWLNTVTGDETGPTSQFFSPLHYLPSSWKAVPHHPGLRPLLFTNSSVSSFTSHKNQTRERAVRRGLRSYPRRLECLTFVDVTTKAAHSSVILRPWVLVRPGIEPATSRSTDRRLSNWANRAAQSQKLIVFISLLVFFCFLRAQVSSLAVN